MFFFLVKGKKTLTLMGNCYSHHRRLLSLHLKQVYRLSLYLLAELLQVGDDAVTQAAVHGVCYEVGRTHHPHGLFQRLMDGKGRGKIVGAELKRCVNDGEIQQCQLRLPGGSREASS